MKVESIEEIVKRNKIEQNVIKLNKLYYERPVPSVLRLYL